MNEPAPARWNRRAEWAAVVAGLVLRLGAAVAVWAVTTRRGELCLFDDTVIYWGLAGKIVDGQAYVVSQYGIPHYALRAPGYPLFLAGCRWLFGASTLAPRMVQAALGAASVALVASLARKLEPKEEGRQRSSAVAAWVAALEPYSVAMSALLLSEAVFVPLMLVTLVGLASLWRGDESRRARTILVALGTGVAAGLGVLSRPSWVLFVPAVLAAWVLVARVNRKRALGEAGLIAFGVVVAMSPWWIRNEHVLGRSVPTALWMARASMTA